MGLDSQRTPLDCAGRVCSTLLHRSLRRAPGRALPRGSGGYALDCGDSCTLASRSACSASSSSRIRTSARSASSRSSLRGTVDRCFPCR
jgi:hypothetical protein